ncbi:MAG: tRNA-specific 2-thiouridylase MnmA [Chlamydiae bacterium]|nr:tRNA-specific 2-thiouridylase MnmA [Chlamydiota bacterium]
MKKVVVGMSGGVDSSVSAYLLKQQGFEVIGLFMKNWEEKDPSGVCRSSEDYEDAARVCDLLSIPFYSVNFAKEYWDGVFSSFIEGLKLGYTPNPDILCNREIKFNVFFQKAKSLGADYLAMGHYCQTQDGQLLKGADPGKDQSYFLYTLKEEILKEVLFPIGHLQKSEVRKIAKEQGLPVHDKKDSTGICFIGKRNFKEFISQYIPYTPGNFENSRGEVIGKHDGAAYYTIGQRKGLGIGGPGGAWFVVKKEMDRNVVVIEQGEDHPALLSQKLTAQEWTFIKEDLTSPLPFTCKAKIRYRQEEQACTIESIDSETMTVHFQGPQRAVTPHQSIVFYDGEVCLGGALIKSSFM